MNRLSKNSRAKLAIYFVSGFFALTLLCQSSVYGLTPTPTPQSRTTPGREKTTVLATTPNNGSGQDKRAQKTTSPKVELSSAVLSIQEVKQPATEPNIKILVENLGGQTSKPGDAHRLIYLDNMFFWVTGKPKPHGDGTWNGMGPKTSTPLTQQQIDALPSTTKIAQAFSRNILIPPIAGGKSAWITVDFRLPDPGTYVLPVATVSAYVGLVMVIPEYTDAALIKECDSLKGFFAKAGIGMNVVMRVEQKEPRSVSGARFDHKSQLSPSYLKFMNMPPGKYDGKCK